MTWSDKKIESRQTLTAELAALKAPIAQPQWLWRVFNQGLPDGHENGTNEWSSWVLISEAWALRLAAYDSNKRCEFVPYLPSIPTAR